MEFDVVAAAGMSVGGIQEFLNDFHIPVPACLVLAQI